ncbi:MAG: hypothetical protein IT290_00665 [Deltaproteobacteria bacterium]|nr:hypothetical protein [Deltaproteobacteria bacterium]
MRHLLRHFLLFFGLLLSSPALVSAQVYFRMDYSAAAAPGAGWSGVVPVAYTHDRQRIAGSGPNGEDSYQLTQLYSTAPGLGGEYYWGWNGYLEPSDPTQGSSRFFRWRLRFSPETNFRGVYSQDGRPTTLTNKLLMVGDGCGRNSCRAIISYRGADDGTRAEYLRIALDGGDNPADALSLPVGEWINIQIELDSSTTTSSSDGAFKIWVNNNNYAQPTAQRTGFQLNPVNWRYVFLGAYNNNGLQQSGVHSFRQTGFEAARSFDSSWHSAGGTNPAPAAPTSFRTNPTP